MKSGIVDASVRLPSAGGRIRADPWLRIAEKWNIAHSVVAPSDEFVAVYNEEGNAQLADLVKKNAGQLTGLAVANPWYGERAAETLRRAFDAGLAGLYLNPGRQGFLLVEAVVNPLMELCRESRKPVYCYMGTPVYSMPFQLAELARRFPEVTFVMGHMAWSDFCGYDAIPAALQASNILLETSCPPDSAVALALEKLGPKRLLFGTGYPRSLPENEFAKLSYLNMSGPAMELYTGGNARQLWNIPS